MIQHVCERELLVRVQRRRELELVDLRVLADAHDENTFPLLWQTAIGPCFQHLPRHRVAAVPDGAQGMHDALEERLERRRQRWYVLQDECSRRVLRQEVDDVADDCSSRIVRTQTLACLREWLAREAATVDVDVNALRDLAVGDVFEEEDRVVELLDEGPGGSKKQLKQPPAFKTTP